MLKEQVVKLPLLQAAGPEILSWVYPGEARQIIDCCQAGWPHGIYPYKGLLIPANWERHGELGKAMADGEMYSSVVREEGKIIAHEALVYNKLGLWEMGRAFAGKPGNGYGTEATIGCLLQADKLGIDFTYMGRSYNRTPMMSAAVKAASACNRNIAVIGIAPELYHETGTNGAEYIWGEIDTVFLPAGRKLTVPYPENAPETVRQLVNDIVTLNDNTLRFGDNAHPENPLRIKVNDEMCLIDAQSIVDQNYLLEHGFKPVGILPVDGHWLIRFYRGNLPDFVRAKQTQLVPGKSPIYSDQDFEQTIIDSILVNQK